MTGEPTFPRDDADALDVIELPAPGTVRRGILRFSHPTLDGWEWPYTVVRGAAEGPRLAVISGVHPTEYPAIEANIRFTRALDPAALSGTVVSLPLTDVPAFLARSPFVCPLDGKNPNRFFPGDPNGTFTEIMDDAVFRAVIAPSDALIDLHGGDMVEDLVPFSIYSGLGDAATVAAAHDLAAAFNLPFLLKAVPAPGTIHGSTPHAGAGAGVPSVIIEAGSCGLLTEPETQLLVDGLGNALRHLGMLAGDAVLEPTTELTRYTLANAPAEGMWYPAVAKGDTVAAGQVVGRIASLWGDHLGDVLAPHEGTVLYTTSSPAMRSGGLCVGIGGA